jgi:hypothetical protein
MPLPSKLQMLLPFLLLVLFQQRLLFVDLTTSHFPVLLRCLNASTLGWPLRRLLIGQTPWKWQLLVFNPAWLPTPSLRL